jgi:hypothetical protein
MITTDATITVTDDHLAAAGLSAEEADAVVAVRAAIDRMDGAGWIDVEAQSYPPGMEAPLSPRAK